MYQNILVALDHSTSAQQVFEQALALAQPLQARLMLLHVLSADEEGYPDLPTIPSLHYYPGLLDLPLDLYRQRWESYEQAGLARLQQFAEQARGVGVQVEITQLSGAAGHLICELGQSWRADVICMGSRGRAGLSELLLGSVSNFVMHHAPCSVLIMRDGPDPEDHEQSKATQSHEEIDVPQPAQTIPRADQQRALTHLSGWQ